MIKLKYLLLVASVYLAGCAHPIVISARTDKLPQSSTAPVQKNVGYYIAASDKTLEVESEGGGGDKIKYKPYEDLDAGIYKVLLNTYKNVIKLQSIEKQNVISNNVTYVFIPKIITKSSSTGVFTWPATDFEIELTMQAHDHNGAILWTKAVKGKGHAEFDEFKHDFQLSARRASEELLANLQKEILAESKLK